MLSKFFGLGKPTHLRGSRSNWTACGMQSSLLSDTAKGANCRRCAKTRLYRAMAAFDRVEHLQKLRDNLDKLTQPPTDA